MSGRGLARSSPVSVSDQPIRPPPVVGERRRRRARKDQPGGAGGNERDAGDQRHGDKLAAATAAKATLTIPYGHGARIRLRHPPAARIFRTSKRAGRPWRTRAPDG
ncbi:hypothetical protein Pflav_046200 [Phytohabitans flavus]|uniref:Uncharacterized protein n=1 Tax=Phytohabitans flavus TaxID=1076124 RepID=A0A6F8XWM4_9ACTN|nr:hypothetical protein Pflav_046200 [Phytohabitans flavus]